VKEWLRLRIDRPCGFCGHRIDAGELVLAFGAARKLRCLQCAGEPAPAILPVIQSTPRKPLDLTRIGLLALDWAPTREAVVPHVAKLEATVRTRALRSEWMPFVEREPGCDDE
jgi:hypothetical protein